MISRLDKITERYTELEKLIADPSVIKDTNRYKKLMQEYSQIRETVDEYKQYTEIEKRIEDTKELMEEETGSEIIELAKEELQELDEEAENIKARIKILLIPKDPLDLKNIIMEIRAGTGGDEAALFCADLFRMYSKYAETKGWKIEIMSTNEIGIGGFKEISFSISGKNVYENLRFESGVHRVQRVPATESSGRLHTSAVTVAVLPEAENTDIHINQEDLKVDVYRSSGPGGQSVNTTDSAVRITHLPTNLVVTCQDEKSQHKNKEKAMRVLKARLFEAEEAKKQKERSAARKSQIGSGDRSERIRTYNFPQNRMTDHRINLTLYKLDAVMNGNLEELLEALKLNNREQYLKFQDI